jgi:hypothetical protein
MRTPHTNCVKTSIKTWDKRNKSWRQHHDSDRCGGFHNLISFNCAPFFASCLRHRVLTVTCLDACRCAAYLKVSPGPSKTTAKTVFDYATITSLSLLAIINAQTSHTKRPLYYGNHYHHHKAASWTVCWPARAKTPLYNLYNSRLSLLVPICLYFITHLGNPRLWILLTW